MTLIKKMISNNPHSLDSFWLYLSTSTLAIFSTFNDTRKIEQLNLSTIITYHT